MINRNFFDESPYCTEFNSEGTCTFDPSLQSIREIILNYSKQLAYYILKLRDLGEKPTKTTNSLIQIFASAIVNADFNSDEFKYTILELKNKIKEFEERYKKLSEEKELDYQILKSYSDKDNIKMSEFISQGEKQVIKKNMDLSSDKRNMQEIILQILKSASANISELIDYGENTEEYQYGFLILLNTFNFNHFSTEQLKKKIEKFLKVNTKLIQHLYNVERERYGETNRVDVSFNLKKGKAILVSGHNFQDLENLLEILKKENEDNDNDPINVYTHDGMILAHTHKKFQEYPNLVGHYQSYTNSSPSDFANFPGSILITKTPQDEVDCFIRGIIYTTALFSGLGIGKIRNNDFSALIESTKKTKGFLKNVEKESLKVGYNLNELITLTQELGNKLNTNELKHIIIIKLSSENKKQEKFFNELIEKLPNTTFIISSIKLNRNNSMFIDGHYNFSIIYNFINELKTIYKQTKLPVTMFLTNCNIHTLSHILNLKYLGLENIYLDNCSYFMINPTIVNMLEDNFQIKNFSESLKKELLANQDNFK